MNLIELSNQLKDVPDQFLLKEVQAPSGAYPAYMVVTELTRRKRMRESAAKEMPETTVAEDLVGEQERARAMAQVQNQMAQPMIPSQERLNAPSMGAMGGLGALPEAQGSLAAQDAMGTTPPEMMMPVQGMAGGGMVSFNKGGEIPRYNGEFGSFIDSVNPESLVADQARIDELNRKRKLQEDIDRYRFLERSAPDVAERFLSQNPALASAIAPAVVPAVAPKVAAPSVAPGSVPGTAPGTVPSAAPAGLISVPPVSSAFMTQQKDLLDRFRGMKEPTEAELAATRSSGRTEFGEQVPFRLGFMEDQLKSQAAKLRGREESNINEALIQAGLGIMGSKSPRFLGAVSEGGLSALKAYQQGKKDIQQGERDLMQSRGEYAKAQTLYDAGKYEAGEKAAQRGLERYKSGMERLNTESAIVARLGAQEESLAKSGREAAKLPYDIAESAARTKYYTDRPQALDKSIATPDQITAARAQAMIGLPKGASQAQIEAQLDAILAQSGLRRAAAPAANSPLNRGTL